MIVLVILAVLVIAFIIYKTIEAGKNPPPTPPPGPGPLPPGPVHLTVVNQSKFVNASDLDAYIKAQQLQIDRDFKAFWGGNAVIDVTPGGWPVYLLDNTDTPGALGYHDVDALGTPFAKVFVKTSEDNGVAWESVASHEVLETLGDSNANTSVVGPDGCNWYREACDACEDISYSINGVIMSDFVTPAWFDPHGQAPFDFSQVLTAPFSITPGGYIPESCGNSSNRQIRKSLIASMGRTVSVDRAYHESA